MFRGRSTDTARPLTQPAHREALPTRPMPIRLMAVMPPARQRYTLSGNNQTYDNYGISLLGASQTHNRSRGWSYRILYCTRIRAPRGCIFRFHGMAEQRGVRNSMLPFREILPVLPIQDFTSSTTWNAAKLSDANFKVRVRSYSTNIYPADTLRIIWIGYRSG